MSDTALSLLTRALRLINVPGRGAELQAEDLTSGFETLKDLLNSEAVTRAAQAGVVRHFFPLVSGQVTHTYGPGGDFDTNPFDDPVPAAIESAFIRSGVTIQSNEQVDDYAMEQAGAWTIVGAFAFANGEATASGIGEISQSLGLVSGVRYTVRASVTVEAGDVVLRVLQDGSPLLEVTLDESGDYEYEVLFAGTTSALEIETDDAADDLAVQQVSIIELGLDRLTLPDGGTDTPVRLLDQVSYNALTDKVGAGAPARLLFSRNHPLAIVRLNGSGASSDILVLDVRVNRIDIPTINSPIRLHPDAMKWLRYAVADELAGEYGKALTARQVQIMEEAYGRLAAGNQRQNRRRVDRALLAGQAFNIDRGD